MLMDVPAERMTSLTTPLINGESTHGILVIREGPFVVSLGEAPKTTDRPA